MIDEDHGTDANLPDAPGPAWPPPLGPALARRVGDAALVLTYRFLQARSRDPYTAGLAPLDAERLVVVADDGWRAPLLHLPPRPGGTGEPVLLAHGLGGTARDFALQPDRSLAATLAARGYAVYLVAHRGDREAVPPPDARPFTVDDVATRDLSAAIDVAREHSGFPRVLLVGHALGAQAAYLRLALAGGDDVAALVALCAPVRFSPPASAARQAGLAAALLPEGWVLPARRLQQLASPFVASGGEIGCPDTAGPVARARLRYASGDLHGGVLRQVARWIAAGHLTDATGRLDVVGALRPLPALVVVGDRDPACAPEQALPAAEALGAHVLSLQGGWGHLDPLLGARAPAAVHAPVAEFLEAWRRRCW